MSRRHRPSGFTLVELLVVITIIVILIGLLIPAVGMAVRASRKKQCANNLREMGKAVLQFEEAKRRFPGSRELIAKKNGVTNVGRNKEATWAVMIMPYIEQKPLFDAWNDPDVAFPNSSVYAVVGTVFNTQIIPRVPLLVCPSDTTLVDPGQQDNGALEFQIADTSYVANGGFMPRPSPGPDPAPFDVLSYYLTAMRYENGIFHDLIRKPQARVTMDLIDDGATNTFLLSESLEASQWFMTGDIDNVQRLHTMMYFVYANDGGPIPVGRPVPATTVAPEMKINGNNSVISRRPELGMTMVNSTLVPKLPETSRPSSMHVGGVNVVFADGHTDFIREDVDYRVYQALLTPVGAKSDMPNNKYLLKADDYIND